MAGGRTCRRPAHDGVKAAESVIVRSGRNPALPPLSLVGPRHRPEWPWSGRRVGAGAILARRAQWDEAAACMRCSGLAQSRDAVPPISQRPLRRLTTFRGQQPCQCSGRPDHRLALGLPRPGGPGIPRHQVTRGFPRSQEVPSNSRAWLRAFFSPDDPGFPPRPKGSSFPFAELAQSFLLAA